MYEKLMNFPGEIERGRFKESNAPRMSIIKNIDPIRPSYNKRPNIALKAYFATFKR